MFYLFLRVETQTLTDAFVLKVHPSNPFPFLFLHPCTRQMCVLEAFQHSAAYLLQNANEEAGDWQGEMESDILCMDDLLLVDIQAIQNDGQRFSFHVVVHQPKCGLSNRLVCLAY